MCYNYLLRNLVFMIFCNVELIYLQNRFNDFETMLIKLKNELFLSYFSLISSYSVGMRWIWCQLNIIHFFMTNLMFFRLFFINFNQFSLYWIKGLGGYVCKSCPCSYPVDINTIDGYPCDRKSLQRRNSNIHFWWSYGGGK